MNRLIGVFHFSWDVVYMLDLKERHPALAQVPTGRTERQVNLHVFRALSCSLNYLYLLIDHSFILGIIW